MINATCNRYIDNKTHIEFARCCILRVRFPGGTSASSTDEIRCVQDLQNKATLSTNLSALELENAFVPNEFKS